MNNHIDLIYKCQGTKGKHAFYVEGEEGVAVCPDCTGSGEQTMTFKHVTIQIGFKGLNKFSLTKKGGEIITDEELDQLSPIRLEFYEERECDYEDCSGSGYINQELTKCHNCDTTGKISVMTSFHEFQSLEDFKDELLNKKARSD